MSVRRLYSVLAVAGAAPFVAAAAISLLDLAVPAPLRSAEAIALSYGLAIASFLCGAHWATHLLRGPDLPTNLLVTSNVLLLGVWITYLAASAGWALVVQLVAFAYLLYLDSRLLAAGVIDGHYFRIRGVATALVAVSLILLLVSL